MRKIIEMLKQYSNTVRQHIQYSVLRTQYFYLALLAAILQLQSPLSSAADAPSRPNIICILADDLGYADVGVFGAQGFSTPNIDRLAHDGIRFTDFHVAQAVCSASRAGLMTGCYPNRVGITGALEPCQF